MQAASDGEDKLARLLLRGYVGSYVIVGRLPLLEILPFFVGHIGKLLLVY
jgi:hypothetical protein